jgi:hypothetical protein
MRKTCSPRGRKLPERFQEATDMKAKILEDRVLVYGDIDATALPVLELVVGDEIEVGAMVRRDGREWLTIRDYLGAEGFIDCRTRLDKGEEK